MHSLKKIYRKNEGILFTLPAIILYTVFSTVSIITTVYFSFFDWNGIGFDRMKFAWLGNYLEALRDPIFWQALKNNLIWLVLSCVIPLIISLTLAIIISNRFVRGKTIFRTIYFFPLVLSMPAIGIIWKYMYEPNIGILTNLLRTMGFASANITWLGSPNMALIAVFIASVWSGFGFNIVIFVAALQSIDPTYYECAALEGANRFQMSIHITIPMIIGVVSMVLLNTIIGAFKVFDIVFVMTKGGPYHSTEMIATYMYSMSFVQTRVGYGAAVGTLLAIIIGIFSVIYVRAGMKEDANA